MASIVWVDLSTKKVRIEPPDADLVAHFLGGRGMGAALLFRHLADPDHPLAPENPLIFAVGPLTGTP